VNKKGYAQGSLLIFVLEIVTFLTILSFLLTTIYLFSNFQLKQEVKRTQTEILKHSDLPFLQREKVLKRKM
jgi:hypothetical protein